MIISIKKKELIMSRVTGLERTNRNSKHNQAIIKKIFGVTPKRGKITAVIKEINETYTRIAISELSEKYTFEDLFKLEIKETGRYSSEIESNPIIVDLSTKYFDYLEGHVNNRGTDIQIGTGGFMSYEGLKLSFLEKYVSDMKNILENLELIK